MMNNNISKETTPVVVIGLDGATFDVLDPYMEADLLPNLKAIKEKGSFGYLESTIPPLTAPAWTSFMTGCGPGKHGVLNFLQREIQDDTHTGKDVPVSSQNIKRKVLWEILGQAGYKVGVINVPMTYPPIPVEGFLISGMLTPPGAELFTYPATLLDELPDYQVDLEYFLGSEMGKHDLVPTQLELVKELRKLLSKRWEAAKALLDDHQVDFFMIVFTGTDRLGHFLWPYHQQGEIPLNEGIKRAVEEYYMQLDQIIGEIAAYKNGQNNLLIMSDHGMGPTAEKVVYINQWLKDQGYLQETALRKRLLNPNTWFELLGISRDRLARIKNVLSKIGFFHGVSKAVSSIQLPIDYDNSLAYFRTIYVSTGGIYLTDQVKKDSARYETTRKKIARDLEEIRDPESGEAVFDMICNREDLYSGEQLLDAPDIVVVLKPTYKHNHRLGSRAYVKPRVEAEQERKVVGDHRQSGIFLAAGEDIGQKQGRLENLQIIDLFPTILYLLGIKIPHDIDGKLIDPIFHPGRLANNPPRFSEEDQFIDREDSAGLTTSQQQELMERLRGLGYVE